MKVSEKFQTKNLNKMKIITGKMYCPELGRVSLASMGPGFKLGLLCFWAYLPVWERGVWGLYVMGVLCNTLGVL